MKKEHDYIWKINNHQMRVKHPITMSMTPNHNKVKILKQLSRNPTESIGHINDIKNPTQSTYT